ncbi:MAG: putative LPS assembly protein LptD [Candidatus Eisenbacteria bacterium]
MRRALAALAALALVVAAGLARAPRGAEAAAQEPPFRITADNMTGGRGPDGDVLDLNGNIRVVRGRTVLTADHGRYTTGNGMIDLTGRVRLVDTSTTVTCEHAAFSENDDRLNLDGNVVVTDRQAVLRAPYGWYDRRTGYAWMGGGVQGREKQQRLSADEATYERDSMIVRARGQVQGFDEENRVELAAQAIDFFRRQKLAIATGAPVMRSRDDDGRLTVLRARELRVNSETKIAEATDSVVVERDTLRARADRAIFDDRTGRGYLLGSPRAWDNETVVTGDTLETLAENRRLRMVIVRGHATMDYAGLREQNLGESSRLTGQRVDVYVAENRIDSLMAVGQAVNAYGSPTRPGKTRERNEAKGDTITVFFKDKKVDRARVTGSALGEYRAAVDSTDTLAIANEVVRYDGRRIEFLVPKNRIVLDGQAHLVYRDIELNAKQVEFDSEKQTLVARGQPQILEKGDKLDGHLMTYDLGTRTGTVYEARTAYERGLYRGDRIRKAGDDQLDVLHGSYSTCDLEQPHYHFSSRWMKIYLKDKLVAKPVVFYLRNIPVLALPFYVFPIKPGRHSGFLFPQFEFGFSNRSGQFLRNAGYYWAPNDYMDLTLAGDYYQAQPSYVLRGEGNYKLMYAFDGHFEGRFERNEATHRDDYVLDAWHTQDVSPNTRVIARGNFVSSRDYKGDAATGSTLEQRLNRFLTSTFSVSHAADWASISAVVDRRQDLDADEDLKDDGFGGDVPVFKPGTYASLPNLVTNAPSLSIGFPTRTLGSWGLFKDTKAETLLASTYLSASTRFLSYSTRRAYVSRYLYGTNAAGNPDSTTELAQSTTTRRGLAANFGLADSRRLFGWLNTTPGISVNAVVFDRDQLGNEIVPAATWASSMSLSSTFYGTFRPPLKHVAGIRHVVFPSVGISYSPDVGGLLYTDTAGVKRSRFESFGGIGISGLKSANMSFQLDQRFQLKLVDGEKVTRLDNLVTWNTVGSFDFLWKEHGAKHGLSPLLTSVSFQPPGLANVSLNGQVDPYEGRPLRYLSWNTGVNFGSSGAKKTPPSLAVESARRNDGDAEEAFRESWRAGLSYSYSGGYALPWWTSQKSANATVSYTMTPNWSVSWASAYDVTRGKVLTQSWNLTRRIHCWDAVFTRTFRGSETEYYFRLGVRDQREIYFERGTRAQSFGGIQ